MTANYQIEQLHKEHLHEVCQCDALTYARPDSDIEGVLTMGPCGWEGPDWVAAIAEERQTAVVCVYDGGAGPLVVGAVAYRREAEQVVALHLVARPDIDGPESSVRKRLLEHIETFVRDTGKDYFGVEVSDLDDARYREGARGLVELLSGWGFRASPLRNRFKHGGDGYLFRKRPCRR